MPAGAAIAAIIGAVAAPAQTGGSNVVWYPKGRRIKARVSTSAMARVFRRRACDSFANARWSSPNDYRESINMSKFLIMCAALSVWLSTAALDSANAIGTFRLEGPWPSSSAQNEANSLGMVVDRCSREYVRHAPLHKHPHQSCIVGPDHL
jgi:hypothetical protein